MFEYEVNKAAQEIVRQARLASLNADHGAYELALRITRRLEMQAVEIVKQIQEAENNC